VIAALVVETVPTPDNLEILPMALYNAKTLDKIEVKR
jgi:hypothetical protein